MPGPSATVRNNKTGKFYLAHRLFPGDDNYVDTERTDPSLEDPDVPGRPDCHYEVRLAYDAGAKWAAVGDGEFGRTYVPVDHASAQNLKLTQSDSPRVEPVEQAEPVAPVEPVEPVEQVAPVEVDEPVEPAEQVEPDEPAEPANTTEPTEEAEGTVQTEPAPPKKKRATVRLGRRRKADQPAEPVEQAEPAESAEETGLVEPAESNESS